MSEDDALLIYKCHTQPRIIELVAKGLYTEGRVMLELKVTWNPAPQLYTFKYRVLNVVVVDGGLLGTSEHSHSNKLLTSVRGRLGCGGPRTKRSPEAQ